MRVNYMPYRKDVEDTAADAVAHIEEDETVDNTSPKVYKSSGKKAARTTLFTIDDKEYTVPTKPGPNVTLKFLDELRRTGNEMFAALALLETMLGKEDYQAFLDWEEMEDDIMSDVLEQVVQLALARVETSAGK
jgi:hypothetical protein